MTLMSPCDSPTRRPWRRCSACGGVCHWHDEAWVCDDCGSEWVSDHDPRFEAPAMTSSGSFDTPVTVDLDEAEVKAMLGWAGMAGVGFRFGGTADPLSPEMTALKKLQAAEKEQPR